MLTAILIPVLLVLCAVTVDVGNWYVQAQRIQKAADAAALAGVTYMPYDYPNANTTAIDISADNGFPNSGSSTVQSFNTGRGSELGVTVTSTFANAFGAIFGNATTTIARTAVADYQGPAIMGSPCNAFGNQPVSNANAGPPASGSVVPNDTTEGGFSTCQYDPGFWGLIEGPRETKVNGDRYANVICSGGEDFCTGTSNNEYREENYFWAVRVQDAAVNTPITIELYDPAFIDVGSTCNSLPSSGISNGMNFYAPDAVTRYARSANAFCTGDNAGDVSPMTTSFVLRSTSATLNPLLADPIPGCTKQFRGLTTAPTASNLSSPSARNDASLAAVFHQWVTLCTFTPSSYGGAGDYYLQVRSNVALPTGTASSTYMTSADNPNVTAAVGNEKTTDGINGFAMRAYVSPKSIGTSVAIAGYERMPIWVNVPGQSATFNLLQVSPNAAGKSFNFSMFDLGDAPNGGKITIVPPAGNTIQGTCVLTTPAGTQTNLTNCALPFTNQQFNGKQRSIVVPIPSNYACDANSLGACWWRVQLDYNSAVNDVTTWDASIQGDAIRLVQ
jgi:hypothetical protein